MPPAAAAVSGHNSKTGGGGGAAVCNILIKLLQMVACVRWAGDLFCADAGVPALWDAWYLPFEISFPMSEFQHQEKVKDLKDLSLGIKHRKTTRFSQIKGMSFSHGHGLNCKGGFTL